MSKVRPPYPAEFRQQMVELVRPGHQGHWPEPAVGGRHDLRADLDGLPLVVADRKLTTWGCG